MRIGGKATLVAASAFLGFSATLVIGQAGGPPLESSLVTGSFSCTIQVVDPPGPGVPEGFVFANVDGVLGMPASNFLGAGGNLANPVIEVCDALAAQTISLAEHGGCSTTSVAERSFVGGNFHGESRSFGFVCEGGRSRVTSALSDIMRGIMKDGRVVLNLNEAGARRSR